MMVHNKSGGVYFARVREDGLHATHRLRAYVADMAPPMPRCPASIWIEEMLAVLNRARGCEDVLSLLTQTT